MAVERSVLLDAAEPIVSRFAVGVVSDLEAVFVLGTSRVRGDYGGRVLHTLAHLGHRVLLAVRFVLGSREGAINFLCYGSMEGHNVVLCVCAVEITSGSPHECTAMITGI